MSSFQSLTKVLLCLAAASPVGAVEGPIRFNRDIRPILSENCYHCHGPDANARTGGLRLDTQEGAKEFAIVPGDPDASELVLRINSDDPDLRMPPPDSERALSEQQIEVLTRWITEGADYQSHWSFSPPRRPRPPNIDADVDIDVVGPIDGFIADPIAAAGWDPAPQAPPATLIRRATFDLIGLPPTLEEIDAFVNDPSADAYERLLDRLLARAEFGERMASDWMDVARYSDTYGYQVDRDRFVWPWRDWVIDAYNDNMPYDRFITLQLAGDLLPGAKRDEILATTFNRLHPQKVEGGSVPEEFRSEYVADRTQTVATAMMGLTMECCRCHDHKYDPITQQEYYELSAFFDKIDEAGLYSFFTSSIPTPTLKLPEPEQQEALKSRAARVKMLEQKLAAELQTRAALSARWALERTTQSPADQRPTEPFFASPIAELDFEEDPKPPNQSVQGIIGKAVRLTGDDAIKTSVGNFRRSSPFSASLWIKTPDRKDRAVIFHRSRAWTDAGSRGYELLIDDGKLSWSLIHFWPGNAVSIRTREEIPVQQWIHVAVVSDGSARASGLRIYLDGHMADIEVVRDQLTKNITGGGGDHVTLGERFRDRGFTNGVVDQFRVHDRQLTPLEVRVLADADQQDAAGIDWSKVGSDQLSAEFADLLVEHHLLRHDSVIGEIETELRAAREEYCKLEDAVAEIMVMRETDTPRQTYLLQRGAYDHPDQPVQPATPSVLSDFPEDQPRNRLGLARWFTSTDHPLTSRVAVNRLWQICFGTGLVRTPEDFGSQGEPPTHPELLDWLAVDFVEGGWDVKRSLKQIMMSQTYRRCSRHPDPRVAQLDPENRLYARFPSYRLPAEMLRDHSLAISGRLVSTVGGPPVKPYEIEASFKPSERDKTDGLYRRSLYTYWKRTGPAPAMMALDAAKRDVCRVRRERTSSPIQAFVLLNGPQYVEAARGLAERLTVKHSDAADALLPTLQDLFRVLTSRPPDEQELEILRGLYQTQLAYFRGNAKRTAAFLSVGDAAIDPKLAGPHVAALSVVVGTVMNFDQSVTKR